MRLLATLARGQLTVRQLSRLLPDLPQATLYHHLGLLTHAELLRMVSEREVRSTVEKASALANDNATPGQADRSHASRDDHLRSCTLVLATGRSDLTQSVQQDAPIDPFTGGLTYNEAPLHLSEEAFAQATAAVNQALLPLLKHRPSPGRRRRLWAVATVPDAESAAERPVDSRAK
jgi:hypothetical protein